MPTAGHSGFTGVIDHKLYMVTHCRDFDQCSFPGRWLLRYDPATDTWTELATPPRDVSGGVGGVIGNKFYVGARFNQPEVLDVYDAATNTWTQRTTNLAVRSAAASSVMDGKLYMIGGRRVNADGTTTAVRTTSVYDPATNRWTNVAPMPSTRAGMAAAKVFVNGQARIELVGGPAPGNNLQYTP
jgi:N-acetylneuraminic acid mutarotase